MCIRDSNNGIDSDRQETSEFAPFLNIMNEWFVRDTSKKIKVYNTAANYKRVLQYDPLLKGAIRKNLLTERIDIVKPLGWYRDCLLYTSRCV